MIPNGTSLIKVNGVVMPSPSKFEYGLQDVSDQDAGRDLSGTMHKNLITKKRKIQLAWKSKDIAVTSMIMTAFDPEYIMVEYPDLKDGEVQTRKFYSGDKSAAIQCWWDGNHRIDELSFNIIEV